MTSKIRAWPDKTSKLIVAATLEKTNSWFSFIVSSDFVGCTPKDHPPIIIRITFKDKCIIKAQYPLNTVFSKFQQLIFVYGILGVHKILMTIVWMGDQIDRAWCPFGPWNICLERWNASLIEESQWLDSSLMEGNLSESLRGKEGCLKARRQSNQVIFMVQVRHSPVFHHLLVYV